MKICTVSSALTRFCALVLATFVAVVGVPYAVAATAAGGVSASLVDPFQKASLRVHKSEGDPVLQYGDPAKGGATQTLVALPGIMFHAQKISGVDLATNQGWRVAETLKASDFYGSGSKAGDLGPKLDAVTGADGVATFKDLDVGLYYVTEDVASAASGNYTVANPFVVALPATNDERDGWTYDVSVHAKDQKISPNVDLKCDNSQDDLRYGFSTSLPAPDLKDDSGEYVISSFKISIPLDESQTYIDDSTEVIYGTYRDEYKDTDVEKGPQLEKSDFSVTVAEGNVLTLVLTESGLKKVSGMRLGNPDAQLTWLFKARTSEAASQSDKNITVIGYVTPPGYPDFDLAQRVGVKSNEARQPVPCSRVSSPVIPIPIPVPIPPIVPPRTPPAVPSAPGVSPQPSVVPTPVPPKKGTVGGLAMTGANSWLTIILGLLFVGFGIFFIRRNCQKN